MEFADGNFVLKTISRIFFVEIMTTFLLMQDLKTVNQIITLMNLMMKTKLFINLTLKIQMIFKTPPFPQIF